MEDCQDEVIQVKEIIGDGIGDADPVIRKRLESKLSDYYAALYE